MASNSSLQQLSQDVQKAVDAYSNDGDAEAYDGALAAIQKLQLALEKPGDYAARVRYNVCTANRTDTAVVANRC